MCGVTEMPPIRPARGRTRRGGALAVIALAAIGCLALVAPSAQAQTEHTTQNRFGNAPAISTICHFNRGPRSGTKLDYAQMGYRPLPVGSFCQDGAGSTGIIVAYATPAVPPGTGYGNHPIYRPAPGLPPRAADGGAPGALRHREFRVESYPTAPPGGGPSPPPAVAAGPHPVGSAPPTASVPPAPVARPYSGTAPAGGGVVPPAYAPAAPGPVYASPPRPVTFAAGGSVRKAVVTPANPLPQAGFGLYVYILPEREVDSSILRGIEEFHRCLDLAGVGEAPRTIALMILPTRGPAVPQVDRALSHDLVRTAIADDQIDTREVYVAATNAPLVRGVRADPQAVTVITLGRIAPTFIGTWLARLQGLIEQGRIESPAVLALRVRSLLVEVNAMGSLIGVTPAEAATYKCL